MAPPFIIPVSQPYRDPIFGFPAKTLEPPREGPRDVPLSIVWGAYSTLCIEIDCAQIQSNPISQIVSVFVDNLQSETDVFLQFPDNAFQLRIPANSSGFFPITTQSTKFYIQAPGAVASDQVNVVVYNHMVPPVDIIPPFLSSTVIGNNIALATGDSSLGGPTAGIVTGITITMAATAGGAPAADTVEIVDGTGRILCITSVGFNTSEHQAFLMLYNKSGLELHFSQGPLIVRQAVTGGFAGGNLSVTIEVR